MKRYIAAALVALWLLLWADDTGVLVFSWSDASRPWDRRCFYLIGVSIVRGGRFDPDRHPYRCPLFSRV